MRVSHNHVKRAAKNSAAAARKRRKPPASLYPVQDAGRVKKRQRRARKPVISIDYREVPADIWRLLILHYAHTVKDARALLFTCKTTRGVTDLRALYTAHKHCVTHIVNYSICGGDIDRAKWADKTFGFCMSNYPAAAEGGFLKVVTKNAPRATKKIFEDAIVCAIYAGRMNILEAYDELAGLAKYEGHMYKVVREVTTRTDHLEAAKWALRMACQNERKNFPRVNRWQWNNYSTVFCSGVVARDRLDLFKYAVETYDLTWSSCEEAFTSMARDCIERHRFAMMEYLFSLAGAMHMYTAIGTGTFKRLVVNNDVDAIKWLSEKGVFLPYTLLGTATKAATFKAMIDPRQSRTSVASAMQWLGRVRRGGFGMPAEEKLRLDAWFKECYPALDRDGDVVIDLDGYVELSAVTTPPL